MGEVFDDTAEATAEQFESFGEAALGNPLVTVDGNPFDAIVSDAEFDTIVAAGGTAERGGFTVLIKLEDMPAKPADFVPVITRGENLQVLKCTKKLTLWEIVCGDPVALDGD